MIRETYIYKNVFVAPECVLLLDKDDLEALAKVRARLESLWKLGNAISWPKAPDQICIKLTNSRTDKKLERSYSVESITKTNAANVASELEELHHRALVELGRESQSKEYSDSVIRWRRSVNDLATDLKDLLSEKQAQELVELLLAKYKSTGK